ncbi:MAG: copper chaperone PCu(A)C [Pseudomonadota bacterium]|nr:MAG: copper chaperone PCu(A)C [Pseudomonadota bacterium]
MMRLAALLLLITAAGPIFSAPPLEFIDAWSPEAPPGRMMAGYVEIRNPTDRDIVLTAARSPRFERVEIHTMTMTDGVMRMRRLETLTIPANGHKTLQQGGHHLMLIGPGAPVTAGDLLPIELTDETGRTYEFMSEVRPRGFD